MTRSTAPQNGFLSDTPDRIEEVLSQVEWPWLIQAVLDFFARHPIIGALIVLGLVAGLATALWQNWRTGRRVEQLIDDREASFPRRDWASMGRLDASALIEEAIALFDTRADKAGVATHTAVLGLVHLQRGDAAKAEKALRRAVEMFEAVNHREGVAYYAHQLALLYQELGQRDRALVMIKRSVALYRTMGRRPPGLDLLIELAGPDAAREDTP